MGSTTLAQSSPSLVPPGAAFMVLQKTSASPIGFRCGSARREAISTFATLAWPCSGKIAAGTSRLFNVIRLIDDRHDSFGEIRRR